MRTNSILTVALCVLLSGQGCMLFDYYAYSITLANGKESERLSEVDVTAPAIKGWSFSAGWLKPGIAKSEVALPLPIPEQAIVTWKDSQGQQHSQTVAVKARLPKDFSHRSDEIIFTITEDDEVKMSVQIWQDFEETFKPRLIPID